MSNFQASNLFTTPPTSFFSVLSITFSIFSLEWKTYIKLAAFYFLSVNAALLPVKILVDIILDDVLIITMPNSILQSIIPAGTILKRDFTDHAPTILSSLLSDSTMDDDYILLSTYQNYEILQNIVIMYVASFFVRAFVFTTGEVYCGNRPTTTYQRLMRIAISKKQWRVFAFNLALTLALQLIGATVFFLLMYSEIKQALVNPNSMDTDEIMPKIVIVGTITILILLSIRTFFIAVVPCIVLENKTIVEACQRSFLLCKGYYWFLFFSVIGYFILSTITNAILDTLGSIVEIVGYLLLIVNLIETGINAIFPFVLYMSMRFQSEGITQESFASEIGSRPTSK